MIPPASSVPIVMPAGSSSRMPRDWRPVIDSASATRTRLELDRDSAIGQRPAWSLTRDSRMMNTPNEIPAARLKRSVPLTALDQILASPRRWQSRLMRA